MTLERIPQKNNSMLKAGGRPNKGKPSPKISVVMTEEMLDQVTQYASKTASHEAKRCANVSKRHWDNGPTSQAQ